LKTQEPALEDPACTGGIAARTPFCTEQLNLRQHPRAMHIACAKRGDGRLETVTVCRDIPVAERTFVFVE
jgi:hypothetical protein